MKILLYLFFLCPYLLLAQEISTSSNLDITKSWSQEPNGWTYSIDIYMPNEAMPQGGYPVCILLHGLGGNGPDLLNEFPQLLPCHVLITPTGYENSWNICSEPSDAPDLEMIEELVNSLQGFTNINAQHVRLLGFSNGSALANRVFLENSMTGIDRICTIVAQLTEMQAHNNSYYGPSGNTEANLPFCGYDTEMTPTTGRHYLNICNTNDPIVSYGGGPSVGAVFLPAETAIFEAAKSQGYTGNIIQNGEEIDNTGVFEYNYLSGQVVHLKGDAEHGFNETQSQRISDFFDFGCSSSNIGEHKEPQLQVFPNPGSGGFQVVLNESINTHVSLKLIDHNGKVVLTRSLSKNTFIQCNPGNYWVHLKGKDLDFKESVVIH